MQVYGIVVSNQGTYEDYHSSLNYNHVYSSLEKAQQAVEELKAKEDERHVEEAAEGYSLFPEDTWDFTIVTLEVK